MNKQKILQAYEDEYPRGISLDAEVDDLRYRLKLVCDALLEDEPEEQDRDSVNPGLVWFRFEDRTYWEKGWLTTDSSVYDSDGASFSVDDCEIRPANAPLEPEPQQEHQWPPKGMPILVKVEGDWYVFISAGDGLYHESGHCKNAPKSSLSVKTWRYLPAPEPWPKWANSWIGTNLGDYFFASTRPKVGDEIGLWKGTEAIHVQHREDT
jgi:hypothetical protein